MLIAIDYDNTYTADPDMWDRAIAMFEEHGHEVICVTLRYNIPEERRPNVVHYPTRRIGKNKFCNALGLKVDIWIDDCPMWIEQDYVEVM